jgi:hypothetical protein
VRSVRTGVCWGRHGKEWAQGAGCIVKPQCLAEPEGNLGAVPVKCDLVLQRRNSN